MTNKTKLMVIIDSYNDIFEAFPTFAENNDCEDALDAIYDGMQDLLETCLNSAAFAINDEGIVRIFDTVELRDEFIDKHVKGIYTPLTYDEFIEFAQGSEDIFNCYCCDTYNNCVFFDQFGCFSDKY